MLKKVLIALSSVAVVVASGAVWAQLSASEIERLGKDLTPFGAIKGGNASGSIPAWSGGITRPPANYRPGMHHPRSLCR